jgi:hypothetical protein
MRPNALPDRPAFAVILCAYSEARWNELVAALNSVRRQTLPAAEVVLVVDHNAALMERSRRAFPDLLVVENRFAAGAGGARNSGVAVTKSRWIAFLDDDAEAAPDWLECLCAGYEAPQVLGVGGVLLPAWKVERPRWFPAEFNWVVGCSYTGLPQTLAPVRNLIAANMSVRRDVFESVDGFRAGYGNVKVGAFAQPFWSRSVAGDEETELCIRAQRRWPHGRWLHQPTALATHAVPAFRARWGYFVRRCYDEGVGKARLSRMVGLSAGLSAERRHALRVLPAGVWRGLQDARKGDWSGLARAGAIAVGLMVTVLGYGVGHLLAPRSASRPSAVASDPPLGAGIADPGGPP